MKQRWGWSAVLAVAILFCTEAAGAQALNLGEDATIAEIISLRSGISAQKDTSLRIPDQRYADGPTLWKSEKIGDEYLLGVFQSEERPYAIETPRERRLRRMKRADARKE